MDRLTIGAAALAGASAVVLAALRTHGFGPRLAPDRLAMFDAALAIQSWHAPALLAIGLFAGSARFAMRWAGIALALGVALFCGAVYLRIFAGVSLGPVAPLGGMLLVLGWLSLLVGAVATRA